MFVVCYVLKGSVINEFIQCKHTMSVMKDQLYFIDLLLNLFLLLTKQLNATDSK